MGKKILFSLVLVVVVVSAAWDEQAAYEKAKLMKEKVAPFRGGKEKVSCQSKRQDECPEGEICDPLYTSQWHLNKDFLNFTDPNEVGVDMGVQWAWSQGYKGEGVLINFIDDGVEISHPDLTGCTRSVSYDFDGGGSDPSKDSNHGTSCAGVAVARRNDMCGVGVAHEASYGGVRLLGAAETAADEGIALTYGLSKVDIYSNSWGPQDDGLTLAPLSKVVYEALEQGVFTGRNGKGAIYMWAGGNGAADGDACSYDGYVQSPFTVSIGAVDEHGKRSYYSESCAALLGVATSSGDTLGVVTTDRMPPGGWEPNESCTYTFSGTSAATPMGSGVVALCLQANPNLTWRDVQGVLIHSSVKTDSTDPGWKENGAGLLFNPHYGYGLLNATRAIQLALEWEGLSDYTSWSSSTKKIGDTIPRGAEGFVYEFTMESDAVATASPSKIEHVTLTVDIRHPARNNLTITLTSPSGTVSTLASPHLQGEIPTLILNFNQGDVPLAGAGLGFGTVFNQKAVGKLGYAECTVPLGTDLTGLNVIAKMNQSECTPYEQFINIQNAGAESVIFFPDYFGEFQDFEASDSNSDVLVPVMQITPNYGSQLWGNQDTFEGMSCVVTGVENLQKDYKNFPFSSIQFWGEPGLGKWKIEVTDVEEAGGQQGTIESLQLSVYGENFATVYTFKEKGMFSTFQIILFVIVVVLAVAVAVVVGLSYYMNKKNSSPGMDEPFERLSEDEEFNNFE